ncbi:MAG: efflux RND transporter periplasmic adaptor subunit [Myxococcota bacterium]
MSRLNRVFFAFAITCAAFLWYGQSASTKAAEEQEDRLRIPVRTAMAVQHRSVHRHLLYGTTRAADRARVAFTVGGRMVARLVGVGDEVRAGQIIARLDPQPFRNQLQVAAANVSKVDAQLLKSGQDQTRVSALLRDGVATTARWEQIEAQADGLNAARRAAEAQMLEMRRVSGEAELRAPLSGTVLEVVAESGEVVAPGSPILFLSGQQFEIAVDLPETLVGRMHPGLQASVLLPSSGRRVRGVVESIADAPAAGRQFPMIVRLEPAEDHTGPPLRAGFSSEIEIEIETQNALFVPLAAVVDPSGQRPFCNRVRAGSIDRAFVKVGGLSSEGVLIERGLSAGDEVVVEGNHLLLEGDLVEVL